MKTMSAHQFPLSLPDLPVRVTISSEATVVSPLPSSAPAPADFALEFCP